MLDVIRQQAQKKNSQLLEAEPENIFEVLSEDIFGTYVNTPRGKLRISLGGKHQLENMALVWQTLEILKLGGADLPFESYYDGFINARIPARTEIISENPLVILDGSHNDGSTAALAAYMEKHLKNKRILAVMGMMADKDCKKSLSNILPYFSKLIAVKPSNPRSMESHELAALVSDKVEAVAGEDAENGVELAFSQIDDFDALIVCGSLYLAGDVRQKLLDICGNFTAKQ